MDINNIIRGNALLLWNDENTKGCVDFDAHCRTPKTTISFRNKKDSYSRGW